MNDTFFEIIEGDLQASILIGQNPTNQPIFPEEKM
jgi:hypothetical protein